MPNPSVREKPDKDAGPPPSGRRLRRFLRIIVFLAVVGAIVYVWAAHYFVIVPAGTVSEGSQPALLVVRKSVPAFAETRLNLPDVNAKVMRMEPRKFKEGRAVPRDLIPFLFGKLSNAEPGTGAPRDYERKVVAAIGKIVKAEACYNDENGMYATMDELVSPPDGIPLVPGDYTSTVFGYEFSVEVSDDGQTYELTARPHIADEELMRFYCGPDGVIHAERGKEATAASPVYEGGTGEEAAASGD